MLAREDKQIATPRPQTTQYHQYHTAKLTSHKMLVAKPGTLGGLPVGPPHCGGPFLTPALVFQRESVEAEPFLLSHVVLAAECRTVVDHSLPVHCSMRLAS